MRSNAVLRTPTDLIAAPDSTIRPMAAKLGVALIQHHWQRQTLKRQSIL